MTGDKNRLILHLIRTEENCDCMHIVQRRVIVDNRDEFQQQSVPQKQEMSYHEKTQCGGRWPFCPNEHDQKGMIGTHSFNYPINVDVTPMLAHDPC